MPNSSRKFGALCAQGLTLPEPHPSKLGPETFHRLDFCRWIVIACFQGGRAPACARYGLRVSCPAASTALKPDTSEASQAKVSGLRAHDLGARARVLVVRVVR